MLNPLAQIRADERRRTYGAFLVLFGILATHALRETARDALFLASLPPTRLAWVYLGIAVGALGVFLLEERRGERSSRGALALWLLAAALGDVLFWALTARSAAWMLYALYTWSGWIATMLVVRFWTLTGDLFGTVGQAKRLYGPIVAGAVLGAIFGSSVARAMTESLPPRSLLLVAAFVSACTAAGMRFMRPGAPLRALPEDSRPLDLVERLRTLWQRPFLRRVGGIVFVSSLTLTLVDFLFKSAVSRHVAPERYGAFFSGVYLGLNTLAALVQFFLVVRILRTSRIHRVHALLPALVLMGTTGLLLGGGIVAAIVLKSFDGVLRHSLHRTATEVLYVPLPADQRRRLRGLFDSLGQRGGQVAAALAILAAGALGPVDLVLGVAVVGFVSLWLALALGLEPHYLGVFRATLGDLSGRPQLAFPELDLASLETLLAALNSNDDREVKAAMDVLAEQGRARVIPALILYHPSADVVIRALELFAAAGRQDFIGIMGRLYEHADPAVRAAALRTRAWVAAPEPELYRRFVEDASPTVRATALIGLVSYAAAAEAAGARRGLDRLATSGTRHEKLAVAQAIRFSPGAGYERLLLQLSENRDEDIQDAVARAMREIQSPRFIPKLLDMLPSRRLRDVAIASLVSLGDAALEKLDEALGDSRLEREVRAHVPKALAGFAPEKAAPILLRRLEKSDDGAVRYRILRALGALRARVPDLELDQAVLQRSLETTVHDLFRLLDWKLTLREGTRADPRRGTAVQEFIALLLEHRETLAMERLFRHVGLLCPQENVRTLYRGWRHDSPRARDSSRELLQHLLEPPLRQPILTLVDDSSDAEKLAHGEPFYRRRPMDYVALLRALLEHGSANTRCLVAYHVGELRLLELRPSLVALPSELGELTRRAVDRALAQLDAEPRQASGS